MLQTPLFGKKIQADGVFTGPSPGRQLNQDGCWGVRPRSGWGMAPSSSLPETSEELPDWGVAGAL